MSSAVFFFTFDCAAHICPVRATRCFHSLGCDKYKPSQFLVASHITHVPCAKCNATMKMKILIAFVALLHQSTVELSRGHQLNPKQEDSKPKVLSFCSKIFSTWPFLLQLPVMFFVEIIPCSKEGCLYLCLSSFHSSRDLLVH